MFRALLPIALLVSSPAFAAPTADEILIDLRDDTTDADEQAIEAKLGGLDIKLNSVHSADERFFVVHVDPDRMAELIDAIDDDPRVENVEPNYWYEAFMVPDDPRFEEQWSFRMVDAPRAWETAAGKGVTVAVIDTGVAYENHKKFKTVEDLRGTAFVKGYDFVNDSDHANDDHGHGTHVAGTIAQTTNNGVGVAGIAYEAKIMPLKVLNKGGFGTAADIADAIRFAADEGAQVINMSLGGGPRSLVMQSAVAYARKNGVVVVCAAGNTGRGRVEYPAAYKGAFAVSSVGPSGQLAFYSSYGKQIAIAAPGGDKSSGEKGGIIQNTIVPQRVDKTDSYLYFQGTSMAAPHAAGAAAVVISAGVTDPDKVEKILKESAVDAGQRGWDEKYGHGILNVGNAVKAAGEATQGWAHVVALGLGLLGFLWRQRTRLPLPTKAATVAGGLIGGVGLFGLLPAMPQWDLALLGPAWHFTFAWASVVPVFVLTTILLGVKRARGLLIGLSIGWAAYLGVSAILMPADVQLIPGVASIFDRIWLFLNAGALAVLASVVARVHAKSAT